MHCVLFKLSLKSLPVVSSSTLTSSLIASDVHVAITRSRARRIFHIRLFLRTHMNYVLPWDVLLISREIHEFIFRLITQQLR
jgi:hypothetical protein